MTLICQVEKNEMQGKAFVDTNIYDSLIISTALSADCYRVITEDLQDQQVIVYQDKRVQIVNPFQSNAL